MEEKRISAAAFMLSADSETGNASGYLTQDEKYLFIGETKYETLDKVEKLVRLFEKTLLSNSRIISVKLIILIPCG